MKRILFILLACTFLYGAEGNYQIQYTAPSDAAGVNLYYWFGTDTLTCPLVPGVVLSPSNFPPPSQVDEGDEVITGESDGIHYIRVAGQSVDIAGNLSEIQLENLSDFVQTQDVTLPLGPTNINVIFIGQ